MSRKALLGIAKRAIGVVISVAVAIAATGCAAVAPYERGKLAHPTMAAGSLDTMGEDHLHAISEGATGGSGGTGSGCGCN
ncbi:MAG TPA: DUF4266 domain-containing protein [Polyangiaceae bacterium]|jgi:hypothetical protein|nr:DUF4266 domain-containing protein [Polyangiaceae bacterium]